MLEVRNLHKRYGDTSALSGVNLSASEGEIVILMGPSGCGKSTAIRCINRLTEPDEGEILFEGEPVLQMGSTHLRRLRRRIGFVFQNFNLIDRFTALENVMFGQVMAGVDRDAARTQAFTALRRVGLERYVHHCSGQLSGGQQQRVGIARALAMSPQLMLWDEPTASLDPILVHEVLDVMEELARTSGTTMIMVTHEVHFALRVAHRVVIMDQGKVVEEGPPTQVFQAPTSEVGRKYQRLLQKPYSAA